LTEQIISVRSTDGIQNSAILSDIFRHFLCVFYRPPELLVFALNHSESVISNHLKPSKSKSKLKLSRYAMQTPVKMKQAWVCRL
jgi:hypothetical protein